MACRRCRRRPLAVSLFPLFAAAFLAAPFARACLDNAGEEVDWWFQYKMPNSYKVAYLDANTRAGASDLLTVQQYALDDHDHPPALIKTLRSLVKKTGTTAYNATAARGRSAFSRSLGNASAPSLSGVTDDSNLGVSWEPYLMYNDQPDNAQPSSSFGHTKGVLGVGTRPFWLLHSTPNFPSSDGKGKFYFPESEIVYGQTFLCVAISASEIEDAATQLTYTKPYVYVNKVGSAKSYPTLAQVLDGSGWVTEPGTSVKKFGKFTHVAKNGQWNKDLYEDLVAPTLNSDLVVESWLRGEAEGTYCKPRHQYDVADVENMAAKDVDGTNITWRETQDHAKWAVSVNSGKPYVCIADINRMTSQRSRGGGAFCFEDAALAQQLTGCIVKHAKCRDSPSPSPAPGPSPGPSPSSCCFSTDASCSVGQTCCSADGHSYSSSSTCSRYGAKHHCHWVTDTCIVYAGGEGEGGQDEHR